MNKTNNGSLNRSLVVFLTVGTVSFALIALFFERSVFNGHMIYNVKLWQFYVIGLSQIFRPQAISIGQSGITGFHLVATFAVHAATSLLFSTCVLWGCRYFFKFGSSEKN